MKFWTSHHINAVDIGQDSIKILQLQKKGQSLRVAQQISHPSPGLDALEKGNVAHIAAALKEAAARAGINKAKVISFIGGQRVITRQITMPPMPEDELQKAVVWEAEKLMPIPVADLEIRPVVLEKKNNDFGEVIQLHVLLAAAPKRLVYSYYEIFDRANLILTAIDLPALSLWRVFFSDFSIPEKKEIQAVVDIGNTTSHFIIMKKGILSYVRSLSVDLSYTNKGQVKETQDFGQAEPDSLYTGFDDFEIIQEAAVSNEWELPPGMTDESLLYSELVTEIRRSLDFYRLQERDVSIEQMIITGGGSKLDGLAQILELELGLPVLVGYPSLKPGVGKVQELHPKFTMAFGLALREVLI
ncbi:type IV pilus assembly protein PilM [Desulforamulus putei]|uniref:type IV pilus assembly protein PilM n=1 Tax=Desulforamulus putei TaxID=74701 RepID=UPI002FDC8C3C